MKCVLPLLNCIHNLARKFVEPLWELRCADHRIFKWLIKDTCAADQCWLHVVPKQGSYNLKITQSDTRRRQLNPHVVDSFLS